MKTNLIITGLLLIVAVLTFLFTAEDADDKYNPGLELPSTELHSDTNMDKGKATGAGLTESGDASQAVRRNEMKQAYSELEQGRGRLKSQVNLLKSKIWGLKLPVEQARLITDKMRQVYAYLKNPAMLGAFYDLAEIRQESRQVQAMMEDLQVLEKSLPNLTATPDNDTAPP